MNSQLVISARNAGQAELDHYCPRCCWYLMRLKKIPYQMGMPGAMFFLERAEKAFITAYLAKHHCLPESVKPFSDCTGVIKFPFSMKHEHTETGVIVTARPDMILQRSDGALVLLDLKTSKPDGGGKIFLPQYELQTIGYSWVTIAEGIGDVEQTGLIYGDIQVDDFVDNPLSYKKGDGFTVPFNLSAHEVDLDFKRLTRCLKEMKELWESSRPPAGRTRCNDCILFNKLVDFEADLRITDRRVFQQLPEYRNMVISQDHFRSAARGSLQSIAEIIRDGFLPRDDGGHWATWDFS